MKLFRLTAALISLFLIHTSVIRAENQDLVLGREVASTIQKGVQSALLDALKKGSPASAVEFCHTELPSIVKELKRSFPEPIRVRRTSLKVRNPLNVSDEQDKKAISFFESGSERELLVPDGSGLRFYSPIRIQPLCLTCHGVKESFPADLKEKLSQRYPQDQATGYADGELRGVMVVHIPGRRIEN